jgi:D-apiose dehydrogenase
MEIRGKRLRGGIIGCGFFGQIQLEAWRRMPGVELAAACDLDLARANASAPRAYDSPERMLDSEDLDFVDIATRPDTHLELTRLAVRRGIPVIFQKPMAPVWEDAVALAEAADSSGVPVMIHENWRWQPWFRELKRRMAAGDFGEPITYRFHTHKGDGGGERPYPAQPYFKDMPRLLIYETLVHHLDTARFLFGEVATVFGQTRRLNPVIAAEDQALLIVRHSGGLLGEVDGHRHLHTDPVESPVLGDALFDFQNGLVHLRPDGNIYLNGALFWENREGKGYRGDSVYATQKHFVDCLRDGMPFETGARDYLGTFAAVEAAYTSVRERRLVALQELL